MGPVERATPVAIGRPEKQRLGTLPDELVGGRKAAWGHPQDLERNRRLKPGGHSSLVCGGIIDVHEGLMELCELGGGCGLGALVVI